MGAIDESMKPMLDTFIFETTTLLDQLDEILLESEKEKSLSDSHINEIFRVMHTVKGSAAMMGLSDISELTHHVEDMFFIIRDNPEKLNDDNIGVVFDILFQLSDYLKVEMESVQNDPDGYTTGDAGDLSSVVSREVAVLKGLADRGAEPVESKPAAQPVLQEAPAGTANDANGDIRTIKVFFQEDSQMENVRAFMLVNILKEVGEIVETIPASPELHSECIKDIVENGFIVRIRYSGDTETLLHMVENAPNIASYEEIVEEKPRADKAAAEEKKAEASPAAESKKAAQSQRQPAPSGGGKQSLISVNQTKLDSLVDIMGEIVIAESMVASNPDLKGLPLENFNKSARQLRKLTDQLQDVVMSMRMIPLTGVFQKMQRIVRDMNKNLGKDTELVCTGGETEVDKNIADALGDPLMHMIRNSMDHGIETPDARTAAGKDKEGRVVLSAENVGSDIVIIVQDDGAGLNREKLLDKAEKNGILTKPRNEYSDKEAFGLIMMPGFSTNEVVTEYSGRGVGMDVVRKSIEKVGGTISVDSKYGEGTIFTIKIPLTLAIVEGMEIGVGEGTYTIPITSINQIYKLSEETELLYDTDGTEMVMIRGECYPIIRLHRIYNIETSVTDLSGGILIIVESGESRACVFADKLLGEQQVVVKSFPSFFDRYDVKGIGLSGCTIMGDGSISLILDVNSLLGTFSDNSQNVSKFSR